MKLQELLQARKEMIDNFVEGIFDIPEDTSAVELLNAMAYSIAGGKRIRGFLVMEGAAIAGIEWEKALPTAAAVECFHAYSLVHDDLPAMDNDLERRGKPTAHVKYGEANAILVGDSLLTLGFRWISEAQAHLTGDLEALNSIRILSRWLGTEFLTGGQYLDLKSPTSRKEYNEVIHRKTCGLIEASLMAGATLGGFEMKNLVPLMNYGRHLGFAFQYVDDLLDWDQDEFVKFYQQDELRALVKENTELAIEAVAEFGNRAETLRELARYLADRSE
jgi:geranylgeranyl pyrophosphate synthase